MNLALTVGKIAGGLLAHSQALVADGIHSLSDLVTDVFVLFAAQYAHAEADLEHPYGHERIETLATVVIGAVLVAIGVGIAADSAHRLFNPGRLWLPEAWALLVAAGSVGAKEWLYRYTLRHAREQRSNLLHANAWHHRSDAASSIVVIVGVGGALLGLPYLDAIAAAVVAWMVAKVGVKLVNESIRELIDTGLDAGQVRDITDTILLVDGVRNLHQLRTRQMGSKALVDVHIILTNPRMSVSEGHQISERVRARLINVIPDVEDVTVHIDPEDDEHSAPGIDLAPRKQVVARLEERWRGIAAAAEIRQITLHYLDGRIYAEVELPLALAVDDSAVEDLREAFRAGMDEQTDIADVRLLFF